MPARRSRRGPPERLGLANVRDAAQYGIDTLALPAGANCVRYSDATIALDEANRSVSEVYGP